MMKQLLLFLFFPMAIFGQTSSTGRSVSGPFANRPVCSRDVSDLNAHNSDVYRDTDDGNAYKCLGGAWRIFSEGTTSRVNSPNPFVFNTHESDVESIAHVDIRAYGAYARISSTTCNTRNGSPRVTLGAASNFKNGEYATCYNAGPSATVSTPSAPTVTPSAHAGGMSMVANNSGSTSYAYEIVAEDAYNGRTAASSAASTSTGQATLGLVGSTLTGCTRSSQTVTCTASSSPGIKYGQQFWIGGAVDASFNGNWTATTGTSGTTIVYASNWDTRNGASTSTTFSGPGTNGFNIWGWQVNRVSWTAVANALRYHIYGPQCPGTCNWMGQSVLLYWDDYGATMMAGQTRPSYIPTAAPASGANQHFTFKITAGGGTTTLTANGNAGAATAGNGIVSDDGPALVAAATAASLGAGITAAVFIPTASINVNSYTNLCPIGEAKILINGTYMVLNNTLACAQEIEGMGGGANPQFSLSYYPVVTGTGYPLLYIPRFGAHYKNVAIYPLVYNGGLGLYSVTPVNNTFDDIYWTSSPFNPATDYIGQSAIFNSSVGATAFYNLFNRNVFTSGYNTGAIYGGASPVPTVTFTSEGGCTSNSGVFLRDGWFVLRGSIDMDYQGNCGENDVSVSDMWGQSPLEPPLQSSGPYASSLAGQIILTNIALTDIASPVFAAYGGFGGVLIADGVTNPSVGYGGSIFGGSPVSIVSRNVNPSSVSNANSVAQFNGSVSNPAFGGNSAQGLLLLNQKFDSNVQIGNNYAVFTGGNTLPAAPTCSVASAGPPYTQAGTFSYSYAPVWQNGAIGTASPASTPCTANGASQQITITIPTAIAGAEGYSLFENGYGVSCSIPATSSLTYVDSTSHCSSYSQPTYPGGGPAGIQNGNIWSSNHILGPTLAPTGYVGATQLYMDSTALWPSFKPNGNRAYVIPGISGSIINGHNLCASETSGAYVDCLTTQSVASGTATLETSAIAARTCATVVTAAATGVTTTDTVSYSFNAAPSGAYNRGLLVQSYVTTGNVNFLVCNPTAESLTPPAATLNWRVTR